MFWAACCAVAAGGRHQRAGACRRLCGRRLLGRCRLGQSGIEIDQGQQHAGLLLLLRRRRRRRRRRLLGCCGWGSHACCWRRCRHTAGWRALRGRPQVNHWDLPRLPRLLLLCLLLLLLCLLLLCLLLLLRLLLLLLRLLLRLWLHLLLLRLLPSLWLRLLDDRDLPRPAAWLLLTAHAAAGRLRYQRRHARQAGPRGALLEAGRGLLHRRPAARHLRARQHRRRRAAQLALPAGGGLGGGGLRGNGGDDTGWQAAW